MTDDGHALARDHATRPDGLIVAMEEPSPTAWALVLCRSVLGTKAALAN